MRWAAGRAWHPGGAAFTGFEVGSLEPDRLADIVVVDLSAPHIGPRPRTVTAVVNSAGPADVQTVIIDGRIVVDGGECTTVEQAAVAEEASRAMGNIIQRAGLERFTAPWIGPAG